MKLNYIHNDIEDMISTEDLGTFDYSGTTYTVTQAVNLDEAVVKGWEASIGYENERIFSRASWQKMQGYSVESDGSHLALDSIVPESVSAQLGGYFDEQKLRLGVEVQHRDRYGYLGGRNNTTEYYKDNFTIYSLFGSYAITKDLSVQARINNLTNKLYSKDGHEDGVAPTYAAGRSGKLTLNYQF
jgi:outer membrane receptor protein involved in Fe transport